MDGGVGLVISDFELAFGLGFGIRAMMEEAIGEGATDTLVEEDEKERDLDAFVGEEIGVAAAVALDQAMALHLTQVVAFGAHQN